MALDDPYLFFPSFFQSRSKAKSVDTEESSECQLNLGIEVGLNGATVLDDSTVAILEDGGNLDSSDPHRKEGISCVKRPRWKLLFFLFFFCAAIIVASLLGTRLSKNNNRSNQQESPISISEPPEEKEEEEENTFSPTTMHNTFQRSPTNQPHLPPTSAPSITITDAPTISATDAPTVAITAHPTNTPTITTFVAPTTFSPTSIADTLSPTSLPTNLPETLPPTTSPTNQSTPPPSSQPTPAPSTSAPTPAVPQIPAQPQSTRAQQMAPENWLEAHNSRRRRLYAENNVPAVDLKWSVGVEASAMNYAKRLLTLEDCTIKHRYQGDRYGGENLASQWSGSPTGGWVPEQTLNAWFDDEAKNGYFKNLHFTQVGWRATHYVGCAEATKEIWGGTCFIQVCRYIKAGNCNLPDTNEGVIEKMLAEKSPCGVDCPPEGCVD